MNRAHDRKLEHEVFEKYGENTVRRLLREGRILNQRAIAAQSWLDELEGARREEARLRAQAAQAEQAEVARASMDAALAASGVAERAAAAAERANRRATAALVAAAISGLAAITSLWALYRDAPQPGAPSRALTASR